jgi:hypothetical protein
LRKSALICACFIDSQTEIFYLCDELTCTKMKKLILFLSLILSVGFASAQSEIPSDSIRRGPSANIKEFGGFLLDMGLMNVAPPKLPKFSLDVPNMSKDYNQLFRLNTDATYSQGFSDAFSPSAFSGFGYGYGWGLSSSPQFMQMGSFKLKNGMRINTYGDYDNPQRTLHPLSYHTTYQTPDQAFDSQDV